MSSDVVSVVMWTETGGGKLVLMLAWSMVRVAGSAYARLRGTARVSVKRRATSFVEQGASHLQRRLSVSSHHAYARKKYKNYSNLQRSNEGISCSYTYHQIVKR
jgi:hypothetical protein